MHHYKKDVFDFTPVVFDFTPADFDTCPVSYTFNTIICDCTINDNTLYNDTHKKKSRLPSLHIRKKKSRQTLKTKARKTQ